MLTMITIITIEIETDLDDEEEHDDIDNNETLNARDTNAY